MAGKRGNVCEESETLWDSDAFLVKAGGCLPVSRLKNRQRHRVLTIGGIDDKIVCNGDTEGRRDNFTNHGEISWNQQILVSQRELFD
jgi:hypothetical protein